ncbi:hypothetical protein [Phytohabitans rumicis]|uniref:Uncharacterized protein n=1 Tax=Phytohabitans rumicis TaxID=1076125 RepID=A0A6V8KXV9_9ACTN|nr:hypothetical protein [Phytohabitans rumicis]GFJ89933.1 hypothetical protein Prum_035750 [Phytohabitans rumicis]
MADGWLGLDWGNVPAWVGSVMTGSSLMIAAFTYRRSVAERAREQRDRERAQAAKVSAWVVNSRQAQIRNGNDVAVVIQAFFSEGSLLAAADQVSFAPGQTRILRLPHDYERLADRSGRLALIPALVIVDSSGRSWLRTGQGGLEALTSDGRTALERRLAATTVQLTLTDV